MAVRAAAPGTEKEEVPSLQENLVLEHLPAVWDL